MKELDSLFDIANQNAMQMMTIEEDKQFLLAQRAGRQGRLLSVDQKLTRKEKKIAERRAKEKEREKEETRKETSTKSILTLKKPDESSETDFEDDASEGEYPEFKGIEISTYHTENVTHIPKKAKIAKLMTPDLASALDNQNV